MFVAAFNVTATLLLVVIEKTREIGILKAMGAGGRTLRRIFAFQGIVVGGAGAAAGTVLGLLLCAILARYPIIRIPSDIYLFDRLPVAVRPIPCLLFALGAVVLCWAAALLPARIAARMDPVRSHPHRVNVAPNRRQTSAFLRLTLSDENNDPGHIVSYASGRFSRHRFVVNPRSRTTYADVPRDQASSPSSSVSAGSGAGLGPTTRATRMESS